MSESETEKPAKTEKEKAKPKVEPKKFLSYKESTGTPICAELDPDTNLEERMRFLKSHGCTDFELLDENKKPL